MNTVHNVNTVQDQFIKQLKEELVAADQQQNSDLHIEFKGYLHNKTGFQLRIENIEVFTDQLIEHWKLIVKNHGLQCDVTADLSNAWVLLTCKRILRNRKSIRDTFSLPKFNVKISSLPFMTIGYLMVIIACIYIIWNRNREKFLS